MIFHKNRFICIIRNVKINCIEQKIYCRFYYLLYIFLDRYIFFGVVTNVRLATMVMIQTINKLFSVPCLRSTARQLLSVSEYSCRTAAVQSVSEYSCRTAAVQSVSEYSCRTAAVQSVSEYPSSQPISLQYTFICRVLFTKPPGLEDVPGFRKSFE